MSTEPSRRLPFEPRQKRKKTTNTQPESAPSQAVAKKDRPSVTASTPGKSAPATVKKNKQSPASQESMKIPDEVSKRMVRRMALLCGLPSALGIATFFVSYYLVAKMGLALPHVAVVLVSMGFFGLGVLGLSYGVLSASWDEEVSGSVVGWREFTTNLGRMTAAWRSAGQKD